MTFKKAGPLGPQLMAQVDTENLVSPPEQSSNI
jgi:hypothetical protein